MFQSFSHLFSGLSFSNYVSCRRHYEEVKNTSNAVGPSAVTLKWVKAWKGLLTLKGYRNEQKLWYLKAKRPFALRIASIWIRQS